VLLTWDDVLHEIQKGMLNYVKNKLVKYPRPTRTTTPINPAIHKFTHSFPVNFTTLQRTVHSYVPVILPQHAGLIYSETLFLVAVIKYGTAHSGIKEHRNKKCLKYRRGPESREWPQSFKQRDEPSASTPTSSDRNHTPATGPTMSDEWKYYITCIMGGPSLCLTYTTA
jgi:hypothetical protein